jgi:hypothetical protein
VTLPGLTCSLEPTETDPGRYGLRFGIHNGGPAPVAVDWWQPLVTFDLAVTGPQGELELVRPILDSGARPMSEPVAAGETLWLETPIQLSFDPDVPPAGDPDPTVWTIASPPAPVRLSAVLHLPDGDLHCAADLTPGRRQR